MKIENIYEEKLAQSNHKLYKELENINNWALELKSSPKGESTENANHADKKIISRWITSNNSSPNQISVPHKTRKAITFQTCMKIPLCLGQLLGLNPVLGILSDDPSNVRFSWKSWKVIYSVLMCFGQGVAACLSVNMLFNNEANYDLLGFIWFYGSVSLTSGLFLQISMKWPSLVHAVVATEVVDPVRDPKLKYKCSVVAISILTLALLEHILALISRYAELVDCYSDSPDLYETYVQHNFPYLFEIGFPYSVPLGIILQILNFTSTMNWNYADMFVICISLYLTSRFDQVNEKIIAGRGKYLPASFWRAKREEYNRVSRLVRSFDDVISGIVFVSFASNLFFICLQLFNTLGNGIKHGVPVEKCPKFPSGPMNGNERSVYLVFSLGLLMIRSLAVSLVAARVHSASLEPAPILYSVPSPVYCCEVQRFLDQIHGIPVALTGLQFFNVTRGVVLSVASTIVTYELVLLQFGSTENKH